MGDLKLTASCDIVLPTAWDFEDKSPFISIDSSGFRVSYTDLDDKKAVIIRANHPIPSQFGIFYFEIEIINEGKNGMIGVGYCTKQNDKEINDSIIKTDYINNILMPGQESKESELWGCGYHGDDGYSFCSGGGGPYGQTYTTGDIIGCYLNFIKKMVFYTKNGINLGIACNLPDNWKGILYPCVGFRSQGASVKVNFGCETFEYSAMTNEDINNELNTLKRIDIKTKNWIKPNNVYFIDNYGASLADLTEELTESLKSKPNNAFELSYRGKVYFIMGEYNKALEDLDRLLEIEPDNITALKYRGEINYMMKRYNESIADLTKLLEIKPDNITALKYRGEINYRMKRYNESFADLAKLLKIKPNDTWAMNAYKLVEKS